MVMKLSFTSQTYHKSSIPIKGSWSYMYVLSTLPTSPFFPETFPFFTDFRRDFNCPWSLLSYHFACLKFGINTLSKLSCNGWQSQWVSWHTVSIKALLYRKHEKKIKPSSSSPFEQRCAAFRATCKTDNKHSNFERSGAEGGKGADCFVLWNTHLRSLYSKNPLLH